MPRKFTAKRGRGGAVEADGYFGGHVLYEEARSATTSLERRQIVDQEIKAIAEHPTGVDTMKISYERRSIGN